MIIAVRKIVVIFIVSLGGFATSGKTPNDNKTKSASLGYSTYNTFDEMLNATDTKYFDPVRISPAGTKKKPMYHGFFYYNSSPNELYQFDPDGRYMLALRIFVEGRKVQLDDKGEVGYFDLQKNNKWTKIGETTTWNWQQGCRLQWVPGSFDEIIWNDRTADGKSLISKVYNFKTKQTRTMPMTVYVLSPDGQTALSVNFERIVHGGCKYVGIDDPYKNVWAPSEIGIWKMDMKTGKTEVVMSVRDMAKKLYPDGLPSDTIGGTCYFFREGYNPSGNRIIAFLKDSRQTAPGSETTRTEGFSMNPDGSDARYFYKAPSHHYWLNDEELIDNWFHKKPDGTGGDVRGYFRFVDDDSGQSKEWYFDAPNGHATLHRDGDWMLTDCYSIGGYIYLYMYHFPTKKIAPLCKLAYMRGGYMYPYDAGSILRVDLHPRFTPDGKSVCFDSTHEGLGRQVYLLDISHILENPPVAVQ